MSPSDLTQAIGRLGQSHASVVQAASAAADAAHLLAGSPGAQLAQSISQALLAVMDRQYELAALLGLGEPAPAQRPTLTLVQGGAR